MHGHMIRRNADLWRRSTRLYDKSAKDRSANDTSAKPTVRTPTVRRGQQCEWDKSANVKCANASSAMRHRCEKSATAVRMPTVRIAFFLFTDSDWIWTERNKGASENLNAQGDMLSHSNWPFFSSPSPSTPWLQCLCLCKLLCQFKRRKGNAKALVHGAVLQHYTELEKRTGENWFRRSRIFGLLSGPHDQNTVQSLPKVKWLLREWKIVLICKPGKNEKKSSSP